VTLQVAALQLGPYQTNCYLVAREGAATAVIVDPGDEPQRVLDSLGHHGWTPGGILVTHGHLDHIGAVKALAEQTGVDVWMARGDADSLRTFRPAPYDPEHVVGGGETAEIAGVEFRAFDVPGHTAGSVAFATEGMVFSGDVLFAGSVGRTDLAGGDMPTLVESIALLMRELPGDTVVLSGHGPPTTLEQERATNPFLGELRS
jgi:glyoxylase-like metal-dependent hydrolase (beta-lactamase superfamily II)